MIGDLPLRDDSETTRSKHLVAEIANYEAANKDLNIDHNHDHGLDCSLYRAIDCYCL